MILSTQGILRSRLCWCSAACGPADACPAGSACLLLFHSAHPCVLTSRVLVRPVYVEPVVLVSSLYTLSLNVFP